MTVPTLNVAGWWDQEDFYGPLKIYETLETHDRSGVNFLVAGPWNHGGWARTDGSTLGRDQIRRRHLEVLSGEDRGALLRLLSEG